MTYEELFQTEPTPEETEATRSTEVAELLAKTGVDRDEIETVTCGNVMCVDWDKPLPRKYAKETWDGPACMSCGDAFSIYEKKPHPMLEVPPSPVMPSAPVEPLPSSSSNGAAFAPAPSVDEPKEQEAAQAAAANSETAGKAIAAGLVPELGAVLTKFEPGALAYGFPPEVEALIERAKLDPVQTEELLKHFRELFAQINRWELDVDSIQIVSVEDKENIARAKEIAKAIQKERLNAEKRKKIIKEPYLRPGQLIDGVFKVYVELMSPIEKTAIAKAQYVENLEKERKETIRLDRIEQLKPFVENIGAFNLHPDVMTDEAFQVTLDNCKAAHAAREKARLEAEAAQARVQRSKDRSYQLLKLGFSRDDESRRHLIGEITIYDNDLENESDTAWQTRITDITPRVEAIRAEQKRLADEAATLRQAEEQRQRAATDETLRKQREAEALALAPDKVKLEKLAADIEAIIFPDVSNDRTIAILGDTKSDLYQVVTRLRAKLNQLPS